MNKLLYTFLAFLLLVSAAIAHEEVTDATNIAFYTGSESMNYVIFGSVIIGGLIIFSIFYKEKTETIKWILFLSIVIIVSIVTAYLAGSTIYLNSISATAVPVHWHADFELWNCGIKLDLADPEDLSNRVGSPTVHEHGDDRIHVEGVLLDIGEADIFNFFHDIGGHIEIGSATVPTTEGMVELHDGELCNGKPGKLQMFVYKIDNPEATKQWVYTQEKVEDFPEYILAPYSNVPPGDCIIIEFGQEKNSTQHLCETYEIAVQRGELSGG